MLSRPGRRFQHSTTKPDLTGLQADRKKPWVESSLAGGSSLLPWNEAYATLRISVWKGEYEPKALKAELVRLGVVFKY